MADATQTPSPAMQHPSPADGSGDAGTPTMSVTINAMSDGTFTVSKGDDDDTGGDDSGAEGDEDAGAAGGGDADQTFQTCERAVAYAYTLLRDASSGSAEDQMNAGYSGDSGAAAAPTTGQA